MRNWRPFVEAWRTGQIDRLLPFHIGPMNGREALESGYNNSLKPIRFDQIDHASVISLPTSARE
jgi:hypothetical protein